MGVMAQVRGPEILETVTSELCIPKQSPIGLGGGWVAGVPQDSHVGVNHGGCPYADGQTCLWLLANKFSLFWLLSPVSHLPHVPWPQAPGFGGFGKKPVTQRAQNALWNPESNPLYLSFPVCFFSRKLGKLCFL